MTPTYAQDAGGGGGFVMERTAWTGGREALFVLYAPEKRLLVYDYDGKNLRFLAVRDIQWDLKIREMNNPPRETSVENIRGQYKKMLEAENKEKDR